MVRHAGEDFIYEERVAIAPVLSLQAASVESTELETPQANGFATDGNATFSEEIFDVAVTQFETIVEPDGIADDAGWESLALVGIHRLILAIWRFNLAIPLEMFIRTYAD
jgi:hypothetical protein